MVNKHVTGKQRHPLSQLGELTRKSASAASLLFMLLATLPSLGADPTYPISPDVETTRQRTVRPLPLPEERPYLTITEVDRYGPRGYSGWTFGDPVDAGASMPDGSAVGTYYPTATLLTFFSISDIHIVDKESPAQAIYGVLGPQQTPPLGFGNVNTSAYSPIMLSTTQVLDAAVQTINALHRRTPFDFGISLGDDANSTQYNELRWFIDVMDGRRIHPSSGAHRGAKSIDYQRPYQASGLDAAIPWYATIGNHDQFWCGSLFYNDYARSVVMGNKVMDMGYDDSVTPPFPSLDARGTYMGVLDGKTEYGTIMGTGTAETMAPPIIAPDPKRRSLTTETSTTLNWMKEFFDTTSEPKGHGFTQANLDDDFACYTFEPKASVPLKVIVLDDTCKENPYAVYSSYARGCLDQKRYDWLVNELERGQAEGKLMIIAAHVPVGPQLNVPDAPLVNPTPPATTPLPNTTLVPLFFSLCPTCKEGDPLENFTPVPPYTVVNDALLLSTLHNYSNLILWMSGHRHINAVTPQPERAGTGPEFGFWEVETPSLRDHPQQFRTFQIVRNDNNTVSIFITDVDPAVQGTGSPADKSRGYALGAARISAGFSQTPCGLTDVTSHAYNAELIKPLPAPYTLTVEVSGPGAVTSSPYAGIDTSAGQASATYLPGTQVTLVAMPEPGAAFAGWSTCSGQSTCTMPMNGDVTVKATFTSQPTPVVSPSYFNFGKVKIGEKAGVTFTVKNTSAQGLANLVIGTLSIAGAPAGQFALVAGKDNCSGQTLSPGTSRTFRVSFAPTGPYTKVATVSIPYNSSPPNTPVVIQLTGVGK
jgi:hypothetical protein